MRKVSILVVSPPALSQIIEYLFRDRPEFEVVGRLSGLRSVGQQVGRLRPELIVANVKPVTTAVCQVVASIKRSSPLSKLILVCPARDFMTSARRCGADACLEHEELVRRLFKTAWVLSARPKPPASRNRRARVTRSFPAQEKNGTQKRRDQ